MCGTGAGIDERQLFVPERDRGKGIIYCGKKEQMFQLAVKEQTSFGIEIDMEQDTVSFHFREERKNCRNFVT